MEYSIEAGRYLQPDITGAQPSSVISILLQIIVKLAVISRKISFFPSEINGLEK